MDVFVCTLPGDGREEDGSFRGSAAAAYNVQVFSSILLLVASRGACSHGLAPPGRRRRRRSSRTQLTAPVVVGWWIASCASPIWTCTRKSMSTPLLYVYVHTYIHVPCSTGSSPYHPRTQSTLSFDALLFQKGSVLWYSKNVHVPAERAKWENSFHISKKKKKKGHISCYKTGTCSDDKRVECNWVEGTIRYSSTPLGDEARWGIEAMRDITPSFTAILYTENVKESTSFFFLHSIPFPFDTISDSKAKSRLISIVLLFYYYFSKCNIEAATIDESTVEWSC